MSPQYKRWSSGPLQPQPLSIICYSHPSSRTNNAYFTPCSSVDRQLPRRCYCHPCGYDETAVSAITGRTPVFVGTFTDESGEEFDLYDERSVADPSTALDAFHSNIAAQGALQKRDWKDCKDLRTAQYTCCSAAHGLGKLVQHVCSFSKLFARL